MPIPSNIASFWNAFTAAVSGVDDARFYEAFSFGDDESMANELAELVLRGTKRATTAAVWTFDAEGKRLPAPGDLSVVTNGSGQPLCIIETRAVDVMPFHAVKPEFAAVEGEGDGSLAFWQSVHRDFFTRECVRAGRSFTDDMLVACERFDVVYRPAGDNAG